MLLMVVTISILLIVINGLMHLRFLPFLNIKKKKESKKPLLKKESLMVFAFIVVENLVSFQIVVKDAVGPRIINITIYASHNYIIS